MQRQAVAGPRQSCRGSGQPVHRRDRAAHLVRRLKRIGADGGGVAASERENRQEAVAHEFEHLAAMTEDHRHLAIEIAVEQRHQLGGRDGIGEGGEAAHVGQPDDCLDRLAEAAADLPAEDARAGVAADIGVEEIGGGTAQRVNLGEPGERRSERH